MSLDSDLIKEGTSSIDVFETVSNLANYISSIPAVTYTAKVLTGLAILTFGNSPQQSFGNTNMKIYRGHPDFIGPRLPYALELLQDIKDMEPCVTRPAKRMGEPSRQYGKLAPVVAFSQSEKPAA